MQEIVFFLVGALVGGFVTKQIVLENIASQRRAAWRKAAEARRARRKAASGG